MERIPEPELMDEEAQARAYAEGAFDEPHEQFVSMFLDRFGPVCGRVLDLGCGPADVTIRFARRNPECRVLGVDGASTMIRLGNAAVSAAGLDGAVELLRAYLPGGIPGGRFEAVISNSLLHHLAEPTVLWQTIRDHSAPGAPVFVMDLMRPESASQVDALVAQYAAGEPPVLRHDFRASLFAAYRPDEVQRQLATAGLSQLQVEPVSDRHLIVYGNAP